ncbi:MAG: peptidylprolyl isomerase, partial [bacterium]
RAGTFRGPTSSYPPALIRVVEALGKAGDEQGLTALVVAGERAQSNLMKAEVALSVGRYAFRGIKSETSTLYVIDLLSHSLNGERWKAAYALMRIGNPELLRKGEEKIISAASQSDPRVRMFIATVLGRLVTAPAAVNALLSLSLSDGDWRVRVNAIRSLGKVDTAGNVRVLPALLRIIPDSNQHVSLTAITTAGDMGLERSPFATEFRKTLVEILNSSSSERQKREAGIALAKIFGADAVPILGDQFRKGNLTKTNYVASLAFIPTQEAVQILIAFSGEGNYRLEREALEALLSCIKFFEKDTSVVEKARPAFIAGLQSGDMAVIAVAASALGDSVLIDERSVAPLLLSLRQLKTPKDVDAIIAIVEALGNLKSKNAIGPLESKLNDSDRNVAVESARALEKITGNKYMHLLSRPVVPARTAFDWKLLEWTRSHPKVNVKTNRGSFTFKLLPEEAPFTVINFATLIRNKFFDGLSFHRVVPNFVIQGGDPRGDGWGGPGYEIRSEFGYEHYERGTVGVASSGKDTEGCLWFVTHCDTPHLDGRYTIFGKIISGMDVVDQVQVGDQIQEMTLEK